MFRILAALIVLAALAYFGRAAWQEINSDMASFFWWMFPP